MGCQCSSVLLWPHSNRNLGWGDWWRVCPKEKTGILGAELRVAVWWRGLYISMHAPEEHIHHSHHVYGTTATFCSAVWIHSSLAECRKVVGETWSLTGYCRWNFPSKLGAACLLSRTNFLGDIQALLLSLLLTVIIVINWQFLTPLCHFNKLSSPYPGLPQLAAYLSTPQFISRRPLTWTLLFSSILVRFTPTTRPE